MKSVNFRHIQSQLRMLSYSIDHSQQTDVTQKFVGQRPANIAMDTRHPDLLSVTRPGGPQDRPEEYAPVIQRQDMHGISYLLGENDVLKSKTPKQFVLAVVAAINGVKNTDKLDFF